MNKQEQNIKQEGNKRQREDGNQNIGGFKKRQSDFQKEVILRILVKERKIGYVLGPNGKVVSEVRKNTGAVVRVIDKIPAGDERVVVIYSPEDGDLETLNSAQKALLEVYDKTLYNDAQDSRDNQQVARLIISNKQAGAIIGKAGSIIKEFKQASGASLRILRAEDIPVCALSNDRVAEIKGSSQGVKKCLELVSFQIRKNPQKEKPGTIPPALKQFIASLQQAPAQQPMQMPIQQPVQAVPMQQQPNPMQAQPQPQMQQQFMQPAQQQPLNQQQFQPQQQLQPQQQPMLNTPYQNQGPQPQMNNPPQQQQFNAPPQQQHQGAYAQVYNQQPQNVAPNQPPQQQQPQQQQQQQNIGSQPQYNQPPMQQQQQPSQFSQPIGSQPQFSQPQQFSQPAFQGSQPQNQPGGQNYGQMFNQGQQQPIQNRGFY